MVETKRDAQCGSGVGLDVIRTRHSRLARRAIAGRCYGRLLMLEVVWSRGGASKDGRMRVSYILLEDGPRWAIQLSLKTILPIDQGLSGMYCDEQTIRRLYGLQWLYGIRSWASSIVAASKERLATSSVAETGAWSPQISTWGLASMSGQWSLAECVAIALSQGATL